MPISYTQSYLNQLPWATRMVWELSAYSAGKGEPEKPTLLPQLFTHSSLESLDWRNKNSNQEKNSQSSKQRSRNQTGALAQAAMEAALPELAFPLQQWIPGYPVTWWSVESTFTHPTALLDSVTPWYSRLFHGVQKSQRVKPPQVEKDAIPSNPTFWLGATASTGKMASGVFQDSPNTWS